MMMMSEPCASTGTMERWQMIDRELCSIAADRAGLDAREARGLRAAESVQIWRPLGMTSAQDYMERRLGYAPRTAQERLRVARALGRLPGLERALEAGELHYSAVRELTRVATAETERAWIERVAGKNLRQIEELVAGHKEGDRPDDPVDPDLRRHRVSFEVSAATFARFRQAQSLINDEHGRHLDEDDLIAALAESAIDGKAREPGVAKFQVALTLCSSCRAGWQDGAGAVIPIDAAAVERAECDAQHIGSIDDPAPARAKQDVPPATARLVWRRDHGRCRVPGCRSARGLEIHHIIHRADGGTHDASNLVLLCSACHIAHHDGRLRISGSAEHLDVERPRAHVGANRTQEAAVPAFDGVRADTIAALIKMGWKAPTARAAADSALAELEPGVSVVDAIRAALRHCK
jgi:hypothetical protein